MGIANWSAGADLPLGRMLANIPEPPFSALELGPLTLRMYGLAIAAGVLAAVWLARRRYAASGGDPEFMDRVAIWVVLAGIVGARAGYVLPRIEDYTDDPVEAFAIWEGGLTFFGGLVGGGAVGLWMLLRHNVRIGMFLTAVAPAIPLAQAIGRWGNYFNQELYGRPTELPWALEIEIANRMPGYEQYETFHPTFLYEVLWNAALVGVLLWLGAKIKLRPGSLFLVYLMGYGVGRFLLELIRIDTETRILGLSRNAYNSLLIVLFGALGLWWREGRKGGPDDVGGGEAAEAGESEEPDSSESESESESGPDDSDEPTGDAADTDEPQGEADDETADTEGERDAEADDSDDAKADVTADTADAEDEGDADADAEGEKVDEARSAKES